MFWTVCWTPSAAALPDSRRGRNTRYAPADAASCALAVFFLQAPSLLEFQRRMQQATLPLQLPHALRRAEDPLRQPDPRSARRPGPRPLRRAVPALPRHRPRAGCPSRLRAPRRPPAGCARRPPDPLLGRDPLRAVLRPPCRGPQARAVLPYDALGDGRRRRPQPRPAADAGVRAAPAGPGRRPAGTVRGATQTGLRAQRRQALAARPQRRATPLPASLSRR